MVIPVGHIFNAQTHLNVEN